MSNYSEYALYLLEQLEVLGGIQMKRMFGGVCFTQYGLAFAIMPNEGLYFVVDELTRPQYEAYGMSCFAYDTKKSRVQVRRYFAVPEEVLADHGILLRWAKAAIQSARNTPTKASKRKAIQL
ncbi:TfoX/Sxy family protein [uncultured Thiothrix sp.]|jgi:DNA transformation protein|uniref:TfoX/Sxy family protein n=1 Tax=uncultured Thiothrix sp. TaxID=223185 RepID=UPI0026118E9B|nr:TfoX/Sxy family protein [uncultured Thiothrix sp.]HMT91483.1 TfoX/Sxy family protein [Thiolinea sp.]